MSTGIQKAVDLFDGSPSKLAQAVGHGVLRQHIEHWLRTGRVSAKKAPHVSRTTGIPVTELNDSVDWNLAAKCLVTRAGATHAKKWPSPKHSPARA